VRPGLRHGGDDHLKTLYVLFFKGLAVGLSEDRTHDRGHRVLGLLGNHREHVPHEVHAATLPGGFVQHLRDRGAEALVGVGDHQTDAPQASLDELAKERGPELVVSLAPVAAPRTVRSPCSVTPIATTVATEITRPASRTLWNVASSHR
jgi:hypothetical protein